MNAIAKGCGQSLLVWGLAGAGLYWYFRQHFEAPADMWGAIGGGLLVSFAYGSVLNARLALVQRNLISGARSSGPMQDGKPVAAVGKIRALKSPLLSPFKQRPCVAYGYNIDCERRMRSSNNSTSTVKDMLMGGFAMTPCAVRTSTSDVKILGFAMPSEFPEDSFLATEYRAQIDAHRANTKFDDKGMNPANVFSKLKGVFNEDDGELQEHWCTASLEDRMDSYPDQTRCKEQIIPEGADVCVIGSWSAAKGGLLGDIAQGGLQIFPGNAEAAQKNLRGKATGGIVLAVIMLALGLGGSFGILTAYSGSSKVENKRFDRLLDDVETDNLADARVQLARGVNLVTDPDRLERLTAKIQTVEMAKLLQENGLDINAQLSGGRTALDNALYGGNLERVKMLLESGANPNSSITRFGTTSLEIAFDSGRQELYDLIRRAGGRGLIVTKDDGKPISASSEQVKVIQAYLNAHVAQDSATLRTLVDNWPSDFFESFDRGLYAGTRKTEFNFIRGYENENSAMVLVTFPGATAGPEDWLYTLVKKDGRWKIRRESWDEERKLSSAF